MKKKASRTVSALINLISNFGYQFVNIIVNIILPPLITGRFGSVISGLVNTVRQIVSYVSLVGSGISDSTVVALYEPLEKSDTGRISSIYNAVGRAFNRASAVFTVISVIVAAVYPLLIEEELDYFFVASIVLIMSLSGFSELWMIGKYRALLTADQRLYIVNFAQIAGSVFSTVLTVVLIKLGFGIVTVQLAAATTYLLRIILLTAYVTRRYRYLDKRAEPELSAISKRGAATVHHISGIVIFGSQTLIVSMVCGLAESNVFYVYNLVFNGLNTVLSTVSSAMLAGMGNLMLSDDREKLHRVYEIYELIFHIMTYGIYMTAMVMIIPFERIYMAGAVDANYIRPEVVLPFALVGVLNNLRTPGTTVICAKGHYGETKYRAVAEATICIVGEIALVWHFGIVGVLVGTVLASLYRTPDTIIYSNRRILGRSPLKSFARAARFAVPFAAAYVFAMKLQITPAGYFEWALYAAVVAVASFGVLLVIALIFDRKYLFGAFGYAKELLKRG